MDYIIIHIENPWESADHFNLRKFHKVAGYKVNAES